MRKTLCDILGEGEKRKGTAENARKLAEEHLEKYGGCAQATFTAIAKAVGLDYSEDTFKSLVGLSGGTGDLGTGTCGAVTGAAVAISLNADIDKSDLEKDTNKAWEIYPKIAQFCERFRKKYRKVQRNHLQESSNGTLRNVFQPPQ